MVLVRQDPSRVKKILPFTGELDLTADTGAVEDNVDGMIQRLDMAMQVRVATRLSLPIAWFRSLVFFVFLVLFFGLVAMDVMRCWCWC